MKILPISVVIPTLNRAHALERTVACLMSQDCVPQQIIVVDQSQEPAVRVANQDVLSAYASVVSTKYMFQSEASLTKARNLGVQHCECDIVIFSDDDVDVNADTLSNVFEIMQDDMVALIGGLNDSSRIEVNTSRSLYNIMGYAWGTKSYIHRDKGYVTLSMLGRYPDSISDQVDTMWAMGYFFVIRKTLVDRWRVAWDERLTGYAYPEDLDFSYSYCKRARRENLRAILDSRVRVRHLASKEYRIPSLKVTYMYVINREYLSYKHHQGGLGLYHA